jgi:hypothetical protein
LSFCHHLNGHSVGVVFRATGDNGRVMPSWRIISSIIIIIIHKVEKASSTQWAIHVDQQPRANAPRVEQVIAVGMLGSAHDFAINNTILTDGAFCRRDGRIHVVAAANNNDNVLLVLMMRMIRGGDRRGCSGMISRSSSCLGRSVGRVMSLWRAGIIVIMAHPARP